MKIGGPDEGGTFAEGITLFAIFGETLVFFSSWSIGVRTGIEGSCRVSIFDQTSAAVEVLFLVFLFWVPAIIYAERCNCQTLPVEELVTENGFSRENA